MENQKLNELYKSFLESGLSLLKEKINNGIDIPKKKEEFYSIIANKDGSIGFKKGIVSIPDFDELVDNYTNDVKNTREFIDCIKFLEKVNINKDNHEDIYLLTFFKYYLQVNKSLSLDIVIFNKIYPGVEDFILHKNIRINYVLPLKYFKCEADEIDLDYNLKIKKISQEDYKEIFQGMKMGVSYLSRFEISITEYQLEMVELIENGTPLNASIFINIFNKVIYALRLFKAGIVDRIIFKPHIIKYKYGSWEPIWQPVRGSIAIDEITFSDRYYLNDYEVADFKKLWNRYNNYDFNKNKPVEIAITRFNYAAEKEPWGEKLVDYIIALEALFLRDNKELTYKLALRTAIFLSDDSKERNIIREDIKNAYNLRSKIVHGDFIESGEKGLITKIEEYVRTSINLFLDFNIDSKRIIEEIEKKIL